ncbi:hypothetical protein BGZ63DRAFT_370685 [Mariannaea sp. PMI_226]|nr:hypothetical protein BGZ63DRAFT_370685 [Mariannaea sp. PMI_226]
MSYDHVDRAMEEKIIGNGQQSEAQLHARLSEVGRNGAGSGSFSSTYVRTAARVKSGGEVHDVLSIIGR